MPKIKVVLLLVWQLQHGFTKKANVPPNLTVAQMASVRPRATHATGRTRSTSDRLLFRRQELPCSEGDHEQTLPTALSADLRRVGRTLRRPADIDAIRLLNREQWRQLGRDIAEES